ncbi:MAG TPA: hypothetical protein VNH11_06800 [Pirellulales bacterium]|nr:hypothetical protein [Pirellulales bacterium]
MPTNYLLPCACGKKTTVDAGQAGLNVRCQCGAELAVPTMRGLSSLERIEAAPTVERGEPAVTWGPRQGLMFLGGTILAAASLAALWFWWSIPAAPSLRDDYQEQTRQAIGQLPPEKIVDLWHEFRTGIEQPQWEMALDRYDAIVRDRMQWEMLVGGVAAVGLLLVVIGLLIGPKAMGR